jgi:hypothetical protein
LAWLRLCALRLGRDRELRSAWDFRLDRTGSMRVRVFLRREGSRPLRRPTAAESLSLTPGIPGCGPGQAPPFAPSGPPSAFAPLLRRSASPRESNQREGDPTLTPSRLHRLGARDGEAGRARDHHQQHDQRQELDPGVRRDDESRDSARWDAYRVRLGAPLESTSGARFRRRV